MAPGDRHGADGRETRGISWRSDFRNLANSAPVLTWASGFDEGCPLFNKALLKGLLPRRPADVCSNTRGLEAFDRPTSGSKDHRLVPAFTSLLESYCPSGAVMNPP